MPKATVYISDGAAIAVIDEASATVEISDGAVTATIPLPGAGATLGDLSKYTLLALAGWTLGQVEDFA